MSSGSAVSVLTSSSISRMQSDRNLQQNIINATQNQLSNTRNLYQNQQFLISANNNSDLQINSSNTSNIKTDSVVTSASDLNIKNLSYLGASNLPTSSSSTSTVTSVENIKILSPSKKRLKTEEISTVDDNTVSGLKKRILEHKYQRLKSLKEKYVMHFT